MALWLRRFLTRSRWVALLAALLLLCTPAFAAAPRVSEDAEEGTLEALRVTRPAEVRAERPAHDARRTPPPTSHVGLTPQTSPRHHDPFGNGLGTRLRC